jgi:Arc/MetJ-type ribon-helix-helix transcriptional regulator
MNIELKPEHERTIELALQSGAYQNREEVLDQALSILRQQLENEDWMREQRDEVAAQIATGFAQAEAGELIDGEEIIRMLRRRRAERRNAQG